MSDQGNPKKRGSALLRELHGDRHGLDKRSLELIDTVLQDESIQLLGWWRYGQPAVDRVVGTFLVGGRGVGSLVGQLRQAEAWGIDVFPYGIPAVDFLTVVQVTKNIASAKAPQAGA